MIRFFIFVLALSFIGSLAAQQTRVLVFTKTTGYRHTSIEAGTEAIRQLGTEYGFAVNHTEDSTRFSDSGLAPYDAVIWLSTTGNPLNERQQEAFERYIKSGKGYVGIHAAADTEYDWPFYRELVGRQFVQHPEHQNGRIHTIKSDFPGMGGFGDSLTLFEEWYEYTQPFSTELKYLMRLDTSTVSLRSWKGPDQMGVFHPLAWYQEYAGGRSFYTGIGHMDETFELPAFREHLAAGIIWAATGHKAEPKGTPMLGLQTAVVLVPDLTAAKDWYTKAFGLKPYFDEPYYVGFNIAGYELGLQPEEKPAIAKTTSVIAYWGVDDIEHQYQRMLAAGARPLETPNDVGEGVMVASLIDPWGNVIGLIDNPYFGK